MTQYSGQGRERLVQAAAATADSNGAITFRVGPCPLGFVWQGSVTITNAPSGALFTSTVGSSPWGQHAGATNFGPVQLWGNETLIVTGVGLQKSTQYTLLFFGVAMPEDMAEPLPPVAPLSTVAVETSTLLVNGATVTTGSTVLTPPSLTRRLTIVVRGPLPGTATASLALVGNQSGANYGSGSFNSVDGPNVFYFAIEPTVDQTYTLSISAASGTTTYWVTANTSSPLVATEANQPLIIAQPVFVTPQSGALFDVAGSPVGTFDNYLSLAPGAGNNQQVIAAPGVGNSIYLQSITFSVNAAVGATKLTFHDGSANIMAVLGLLNASTNTETKLFPGGLKMISNSPLQVDVPIGPVRFEVCWTTGPSV